MNTYNHSFKYIFIFVISIFISCSSDDDATILSSEKELLQFSILSQTTGTIDQDKKTITITVPFGTGITSINPTVAISENATYAPSGAQNFSTPVIYTVTAEDGTQIKYTINISIANNTEASLLSFIFKSEDNAFEEDIEASIDQENLNITAEVPFDTDLTSLVASITTSENATTNLDELDFSSEATLTIIAQDGETTVSYTINISIANNTEASLLSFIFKSEDNAFEEDIEASIDQENLNITAEVPFDTDLTSLVASITTSEGATTNLGELDFSSEATLTVIAQDGEVSSNYTINIIQRADPRIAERAALIDIHNANTNNILYWPIDDETSNIADWDGVTLNEQGLIVKLDIGYEAISLLPESIVNLTELTELHLYTNPSLSTLPQNIGSLSKLEVLNINNTSLTSLPESVGNLSALKELSANNTTSLEALPESIESLTQLETLSLLRCSLKTLPKNIGNLTQLTSLDLSFNELITFPESIVNLAQLRDFRLSGNTLLSLTTEQCGFVTAISSYSFDEGICD